MKNAMSVVIVFKKILPPCNGIHTEHMLVLAKSILVPICKAIICSNYFKQIKAKSTFKTEPSLLEKISSRFILSCKHIHKSITIDIVYSSTY